MPTTKRPMIRIHDLATDEVIDREMDDAEYEQHLADIAADQTAKADEAAKAAAKEAVLDKLGLSAEEMAALLG